MPSPVQRIALLEKELEKYNMKRAGTRSFPTIKEDIARRIKILNLIHSELMSISTELFYYNMVDHLGNTKLETLTLKQCISLSRELNLAMDKFIQDQDKKYIAQCDRLRKRVLWAGCNITKNLLDKKSEEAYDFIKECPEDCKEKLRKYYFNLRIKELNKVIKEASENLDKSYQLLITGELLSYEKFFKENSFDSKIGQVTPKSLEDHVMGILRELLTRKNKSIAREICNKMKSESTSIVDRIFKNAVKQVYKDMSKCSIEI